jgi:hypothetical protein
MLEIWFGPDFIASLYPLVDGPGVRIVSKYRLVVDRIDPADSTSTITIRIR